MSEPHSESRCPICRGFSEIEQQEREAEEFYKAVMLLGRLKSGNVTKKRAVPKLSEKLKI